MIFDRVKACIFLLCWVLILSVLASIVEAQAGETTSRTPQLRSRL